MTTIYRGKSGKEHTLKLYDEQLALLPCPYEDLYVGTSYGKTHLVRTGNPQGEPLLVFHGGNSTTAYNLLLCQFLLEDFSVYAVDIIGHPGKSVQVSLPAFGYAYGKWASEVIDALNFKNINCYANSFGAGVLAKLMCVSPEKVKNCVLEVPSGISNALPLSSLRMLVPLMKYRRTRETRYIIETALFMAIDESVIDPQTVKILKNSFEDVKTKTGMPTNVSGRRMKRCASPALVMAGELDCLFPAKKVLPRAKRILPHCTSYQLKGRGHMHRLTQEEKKMILAFLKQ